MNKEEIEEIETLKIDFTNVDELELALELSSKKAIYLIDDLIKNLFELQQENKQLKTNRDEAIEYIKNNIQEGYSEVFEAEMRWDAVSGDDLLEILKRGKE